MDLIYNEIYNTIEKVSYKSSIGGISTPNYTPCSFNSQKLYHLDIYTLAPTKERLIVDNKYFVGSPNYSLKMSDTQDEPSEILKKYATDEAIEYLKKSDEFDIKEIVELLKMLDDKYSEKFGTPELGLVVDEKTDKIEFLEITFPKGSWDEWRKLIREIKKEMRVLGYGHLCSRVAIVCLQGLIE